MTDRRRPRSLTVPVLVTLDEVYRHLRLPASADGSPSDRDRDLQDKLDAATAHVCRLITDRQPDDPDWTDVVEAWTPTTAPREIRQAILRLVADFDRFIGDDPYADKSTNPGVVPPEVLALLVGYRDPTIS